MWTDRQKRHLSDDDLIECYFAESTGEDHPLRAHVAICDSCAARYATLTHDLAVVTEGGAIEADALFTPELLAQQRQHVMRRLESHGRRADVFQFPARRVRRAPSSAGAWHPMRWVAAAAVAGLAAGLGLGVAVERFNLDDRFQPPPATLASRTAASPAQAAPVPSPSAPTEDGRLLDEIDDRLSVRRVPELRVYDEITPEQVLINFRPR